MINVDSNNLLEVKGLYKHYKEFDLNNISFSIPPGYIMGYVGRNGAGKTTTLNSIAHLTKYDSGEIRIDGISFDEDPIKYREMIGYIGDTSFFPGDLKLNNIGAILKDFYPTFREEAFRSLCNRWELKESMRIKDYSRGMKVKLMFASVLSRETKLLILDEATNGLDPVMRSEILKLLQDYISDGTRSVLFSTHIMEDLQDISDFIFIIEKGYEILSGTKDDILDEYLLIKGGLDLLEGDGASNIFRDKLIGPEMNDFGFVALIKTDDSTGLPEGTKIEKASIDKILLHLIRSIDSGEGRL